MPAVRKSVSKQQRRADETWGRRVEAIEESIRNPRVHLKEAGSSRQAKLMKIHKVMPISVLERVHRMERYDFQRIVDWLYSQGAIGAARRLGNLVLWSIDEDSVFALRKRKETIPQQYDDRMGRPPVAARG